MRRAVITMWALACVAAWPSGGHARGVKGAKRLAMKKFDASSSELSVVAQHKGGAAIVRVEVGDVPTCYLLRFDAPPRRATSVVASERLAVCAAYKKEARSTSLTPVELTSRQKAWRVYAVSKRVDTLAKGVATSSMWALYAVTDSGLKRVFERTSTSFKSKKNRALNQSAKCEAPVFSPGATPGPLTIKCVSEITMSGAVTRKTNVHRYRWEDGTYVLR